MLAVVPMFVLPMSTFSCLPQVGVCRLVDVLSSCEGPLLLFNTLHACRAFGSGIVCDQPFTLTLLPLAHTAPTIGFGGCFACVSAFIFAC